MKLSYKGRWAKTVKREASRTRRQQTKLALRADSDTHDFVPEKPLYMVRRHKLLKCK